MFPRAGELFCIRTRVSDGRLCQAVFPFLLILSLFAFDNTGQKVTLNDALVLVTVGCLHHPCGCEDLSACDITKAIQAKKSPSGGFCLSPPKSQNMTIYFHFCIGRKTKPQAFYKKLFVGWNICFCLTCQGLIWISRIIFDKADGLSLSPSLSHTHRHAESICFGFQKLAYQNFF